LTEVPSFGFPVAFEAWLLVRGSEALANEARLLHFIEQGPCIIFG